MSVCSFHISMCVWQYTVLLENYPDHSELFTLVFWPCDLYISANPCCSFPCQNRGVCMTTGVGSYMCDCENTGYYGKHCEKRKFQLNFPMLCYIHCTIFFLLMLLLSIFHLHGFCQELLPFKGQKTCIILFKQNLNFITRKYLSKTSLQMSMCFQLAGSNLWDVWVQYKTSNNKK